jgi:hypothetical protein
MSILTASYSNFFGHEPIPATVSKKIAVKEMHPNISVSPKGAGIEVLE